MQPILWDTSSTTHGTNLDGERLHVSGGESHLVDDRHNRLEVRARAESVEDVEQLLHTLCLRRLARHEHAVLIDNVGEAAEGKVPIAVSFANGRPDDKVGGMHEVTFQGGIDSRRAPSREGRARAEHVRPMCARSTHSDVADQNTLVASRVVCRRHH